MVRLTTTPSQQKMRDNMTIRFVAGVVAHWLITQSPNARFVLEYTKWQKMLLRFAEARQSLNAEQAGEYLQGHGLTTACSVRFNVGMRTCRFCTDEFRPPSNAGTALNVVGQAHARNRNYGRPACRHRFQCRAKTLRAHNLPAVLACRQLHGHGRLGSIHSHT